MKAALRRCQSPTETISEGILLFLFKLINVRKDLLRMAQVGEMARVAAKIVVRWVALPKIRPYVSSTEGLRLLQMRSQTNNSLIDVNTAWCRLLRRENTDVPFSGVLSFGFHVVVSILLFFLMLDIHRRSQFVIQFAY